MIEYMPTFKLRQMMFNESRPMQYRDFPAMNDTPLQHGMYYMVMCPLTKTLYPGGYYDGELQTIVEI